MSLSSLESRVFGERFQATRLLKTGQGVHTLLGAELGSGNQVVIKAVDSLTVPASAQRRLEHEAQVLREVRSPFLTPLLHLGLERDVLFLVMPYIAGTTLQAALSNGPLSVADALSVGL
jgi:serine/threonine protein kinase